MARGATMLPLLAACRVYVLQLFVPLITTQSLCLSADPFCTLSLLISRHRHAGRDRKRDFPALAASLSARYAGRLLSRFGWRRHPR